MFYPEYIRKDELRRVHIIRVGELIVRVPEELAFWHEMSPEELAFRAVCRWFDPYYELVMKRFEKVL